MDFYIPSAVEGAVSKLVTEAVGNMVEDRVIKGVAKSGIDPTSFFAALTYVIAKRVVGIGPFAQLGADPFVVAKYLVRGVFVGVGALLKDHPPPPSFRRFLGNLAPLASGVIDSAVDHARRDVVAQLDEWSQLPNPEAGMGKSLRFVQGLVKLDKNKVLALGGATPSGQELGAEEKNQITIFHGATMSPRKGDEMFVFIGTHLVNLEREAVTAGDEIAKADADLLKRRLERYRSAYPTEAAAVFDASARKQVNQLDLVSLLQIGDEFTVPVNGELILLRHARLNELAALARKKLDEIDAATKAAVTPAQVAKTHKGPIAEALAAVEGIADDVFGLDRDATPDEEVDPDLGPRRLREKWQGEINAGPGILGRALKAIWAAVKTAALWLWSWVRRRGVAAQGTTDPAPSARPSSGGRIAGWRTMLAAKIAPSPAPAADPPVAPVVTGPPSVPPPPPPDSSPPPPPNTSSP